MPLSINTSFGFSLDRPTDVLLQFEAAHGGEQTVTKAVTSFSPHLEISRVTAQDEIGERIWLNAQGKLEITYEAHVEIARPVRDLADLSAPGAKDMPSINVPYLFDTRYCLTEKFQPFVEAEFSGTRGGARIAAIRDWIAQNFTYSPGVSNADTTALDTFVQRTGVCRDYAHVLISLARASAIPARYVACFAPDVDPPDFHAVAQVYLTDPDNGGSGGWYLVDATQMSKPDETAIIGVGRDASDVSFLTTFGMSQFHYSKVEVSRDE